MPLPGSCALFCALLVVLWVTGASSAFGQSQTTSRPLETLEEEFTDPLTTLPQIFLKDAYSPTNYGTNVQTNQLIARAIIPRIPPYTLLPFAQLVRPTFSLVTVPTPRGGTRTEFGDMQLFDLAVPPWPPVETGFRFGLGPTFLFPTATSKSAGQIDERKLRASVVFGDERTMEQDSLFGFRILVDIAIKALSKAINDPTTAVLAIDQLHLSLIHISEPTRPY